MTMLQEWTFDTHRAQLELPDVVHLEWSGEANLQCAQQLHSLLQKIAAALGQRPFLLVNASHVLNVTLEARMYLSEHFTPDVVAGISQYGGGLLQRAVSSLIMRGMATMQRRVLPWAFFSTETDARVWIAEQRAGQASLRLSG